MSSPFLGRAWSSRWLLAALLAAGLLGADSDLSDTLAATGGTPCRALNYKMRGAPGEACEISLVLERVGGSGLVVMRHESLTVARPPGKGTVTVTVDKDANRVVAVYRPSSATPLTDRFELERCLWTKSEGSTCRKIALSVDLSAEADAAAARDCTPAPFQMSTERPVAVTMSGKRGATCMLRLILTRTALTIRMTSPPSYGRVRINGHRVFYDHSGQSAGDSFGLEACSRTDAKQCAKLNVALSFT
jgi:hypothetical protein